MTAKFYAAIATSTSTSAYALFETLVRQTTSYMAWFAGALGVAAGIYAWQTGRIKKKTARLEAENALLQRELIQKQLSKL